MLYEKISNQKNNLMLKSFLPLLFLLVLIACSNAPEDDYTDEENINGVEPPISPVNELYSIEGFWKQFQDAVSTGNKKRLQTLTKIDGDNTDYYDDLFFSKAREQVKKMTVSNMESNETNEEQFYKISIDMSDENGAKGLIFYVGVKDELYCITKIK